MDRSRRLFRNTRPPISRLLVPLVLLLPWLCTCAGPPGVLLDIGTWPEPADSIRIDGTLNGVPFREPLSVPGRPTRFVVYVPEGNSGQLDLTLTALDGEGCPRAKAATQVEVGSGLRRVAEASVILIPGTPPYCPAPRVDGLSPASGLNNSPTEITITGAGFRTGASVIVGDAPCAVLSVSPTKIRCTVPAKTAACATLPVVVTNSGDSRTAAGLVFSYRPAMVAFGPIVNLMGGGTGQRQVIAADLNRDGRLDLASANFGSSNISVYLNLGNRAFGSATNTAVGTGPIGLAAGDLNKDGKQDLVVSSSGSGDISFLAGDGAGGFAGAVVTAGLSQPQGVALGDLDNDGKTDVVVSNNGSSSASVFAGNGAGGLAVRTPVGVGIAGRYLALGDLNRDGNLDLVVPSISNNTISYRPGRGTTDFDSGSDLSVGMAPNHAVIADVDGDGNPDILVANQNSSNVTVLLGNGMGAFGPAEGSPFAVGTGPQSLSVVDVDGDGKPDLVTSDLNANSLSILAGTGTGKFLPIAGSPFATAAGPIGLAVSDLDGDGLMDLASANQNAGNTAVRFAVCN